MRRILFMLFGAFTFSASAQSEGAWTFNYTIGIPLGETEQFIEDLSFLGLAVEGRKFIPGEPLSVGGELSWQTFYQRLEGEVVSMPGFDVSGTQYRYINSFAALFDLKYHIRPERALVPYVGLGLGPGYVYQRLDFGLWTLSDDSWRLVVRPDAGLMYQFTSTDMGVHLGVNYNHFFKTKDADGTTFVGVRLGLVSYF